MSPQEFAGRLTAEGFRVRLNEPLDSCIQRKSDAVVLDFIKGGEEQDERGDERTHGRLHTDQETHAEDRQNNAPSRRKDPVSGSESTRKSGGFTIDFPESSAQLAKAWRQQSCPRPRPARAGVAISTTEFRPIQRQ